MILTLASGISTATSTPNLFPFLPLTLNLFTQLPINVTCAGGSKATVHCVCSVGNGAGKGTQVGFCGVVAFLLPPFSFLELLIDTSSLCARRSAARSGCSGATGGIEVRNVCSWFRKRSSGGMRLALGRTFGNNASILIQQNHKVKLESDNKVYAPEV
jgi:hypothetical protein